MYTTAERCFSEMATTKRECQGCARDSGEKPVQRRRGHAGGVRFRLEGRETLRYEYGEGRTAGRQPLLVPVRFKGAERDKRKGLADAKSFNIIHIKITTVARLRMKPSKNQIQWRWESTRAPSSRPGQSSPHGLLPYTVRCCSIKCSAINLLLPHPPTPASHVNRKGPGRRH